MVNARLTCCAKTAGPACPWRINPRGRFILRGTDDRPSELRGRKTRAIVGYLAVHAGQHVSRDQLIELLWPDRRKVHARGSLRQCLLEIRRTAPGLISSDQEHVWLERHRVVIDRLQNRMSASELFDDLDGISPQFDDWLRCQRAEDANREWTELERNVEDMLISLDGRDARPLIERMQRIDPYSEDWVRLAMRAECQLGHPAGVVKYFTRFAECLSRDLGVLPAAETRVLHDRLLVELTVEKPRPELFEATSIDPERLYGMG